MEDYMEAFEYDNSEPEDAWWNEQNEDHEWSEEEGLFDQKGQQESYPALDELLEILSGAQSYGNMGDYYNMELGCYVFPNHEVYEYFIDVDASGHEWTETSDGHWIPLLYLEKYELYISDGEAAEGPEEEDLVEVLPTESELETLETLESVRGLLAVIKENNTAYFDEALEYQEEMLITEQKAAAMAEGILYAGITQCILLAVIAGTFVSHVFFGRMRAG